MIARASPRLTSLATALPPHVVGQDQAREFVERLFGEAFADDRRLFAVFDHAGIERRHVCMPLEWYGEPHHFGEANECYVEHALTLSAQVARDALERSGLAPEDVDQIVFVSSTGIATPSLDARLANTLGFRRDVRRTPLWGLGCAGGAAGLARAREFAVADPETRVLLIAIELCSLTFQRGEPSRRNLVATSLFSDGAAAAVIAGAQASIPARPHPPLALRASRSTLWPDSLDVMGWEVDQHGLHVVFSRDIPTIVRDWVRPDFESFLAQHGLRLETLDRVIAHPGGPKVLAAYEQALGLPRRALRHSEEVLRLCGNMSSPTCLFVLERALAANEPGPGETAVLAALGPGFASEYVLLEGLP